jgi:hypothetical protein
MDNTETATNYVEYINRLPGVISSDVVIDGDNISEVHVLSNSTRTPKQLVRDVQSVFSARFHKKIDHKVVSVAQIDLPMSSTAVAAATAAAAQTPTTTFVSSHPRLSIEELCLSKRQNDTEVKVSLSFGGQQYACAQTCSNDKSDYYRTVAQATLGAACQALDYALNFSVLDVRLSDIASETAVLVCVSQAANSNVSNHFCGSAFVTDDRETAVVKATLNAINRLVRVN